MERFFEKPLIEAQTRCICRQPGSTRALLVKTKPWGGGAVSRMTEEGVMVSHRFIRTDPPMGPKLGVRDDCLTATTADSPLEIAADFIELLTEDRQLANDGELLTKSVPSLKGEVVVELKVPTDSPWRWEVVVNGTRAAATNNDWHVIAMRDLVKRLRANARQQMEGVAPSQKTAGDSDLHGHYFPPVGPKISNN